MTIAHHCIHLDVGALAMTNSIDFCRGEFVATARSLLAVYMRLKDDLDNSLLEELFNAREEELKRLIGNAFQFRNDIGDPVQLSLLILLMNSEQHTASGKYIP